MKTVASSLLSGFIFGFGLAVQYFFPGIAIAVG